MIHMNNYIAMSYLYCDGLVFHLVYIPNVCPVFPEQAVDSLQTWTRVQHLLKMNELLNQCPVVLINISIST